MLAGQDLRRRRNVEVKDAVVDALVVRDDLLVEAEVKRRGRCDGSFGWLHFRDGSLAGRIYGIRCLLRVGNVRQRLGRRGIGVGCCDGGPRVPVAAGR